MISIAREGYREIALATMILGAGAAFAVWLTGPSLPAAVWGAAPFLVMWLGVLAFFRDPDRQRSFAPGELCAPADGKVTEVAELDWHEPVGGPAVRIGVFLSLLDVHINRSPCSGRVRRVSYRPGAFLDARRAESGPRNESNALLLEPDGPMPGPVEVRQIAGKLARRIVCHAEPDQHLSIGARFGLIKFGSRTELIIPRRRQTEIKVRVGDKVRAGLTVVARQPTPAAARPREAVRAAAETAS